MCTVIGASSLLRPSDYETHFTSTDLISGGCLGGFSSLSGFHIGLVAVAGLTLVFLIVILRVVSVLK